ncbi:MAG: mandelate racemase/muconate lactonizing enzyme family protein [Chloroflexi bacterium]|nr:mandelate racemase/muconate lactonizing enzyme family protein [Chloroflexota bacterium]
MRIERIDQLLIGRYLLVQIHTDAGISGLGEAGMWGYLEANAAVIRAWEPYLIGQDPRRIEHHWQYLYRNAHFRGASVTGALGAIDTALWDIVGRYYQAPVYQLLGGRVRDRIRVQTQASGATPEEVADAARAEVARGITAVRVTPFRPDFPRMRYDQVIADAVAFVGAVREAVGTGIDIGVEIHRRLSPAEAVALADELKQFRPLYYEDPIAPESIQSAGEIARAITLPVATGERLQTIHEYRELLVSGGARFLRVDPCLAGGLTAAKKIAAIGESFHAGMIPHGSLSTVGTAIAVQLDASIPNFVVQDYLDDDRPPKNDFLVENLRLENGYLVVPDRPGIGVELKPGLVDRYPHMPRAIDTPLHEDGSVADR